MSTAAVGGKYGGLRAFALHRPLTTFLILTYGVGWVILTFPVLAHYGVLPGKEVPIEVYALATTLLVMLPAALWVTWVVEGRAGVRALLGRALRWRVSPLWYVVALAGLPTLTIVAGVLAGGSFHAAKLGGSLLNQGLQILLAALLINIWEETAWAGFFQTRLEQRHNIVVAAALTAIPFAGIHVPLLLVDDRNVVTGYGKLLLFGILVRLMMGITLRAAGDSVLIVGLLHSVLNQSNNPSGIVADLLSTDADPQIFAVLAAVILTGILAWVARGRLGRGFRRPPAAPPESPPVSPGGQAGSTSGGRPRAHDAGATTSEA
jgi:membrane protease YdiL (CAAX protease family)